MNFDIGYHVVSKTAVQSANTFDDEMSIVEFLRRVEYMEDLPYDVTVHGLDSYVRGADDPEATCEYIHKILSERVNYLLNKNPRVQFVVSEVEFWDEPVLLDGNDHVRLNTIFHGALRQEGAGWFSSNLNVTS
jgi:hypothetical protein